VDEIAQDARDRWQELSGEGIRYSVPWLDLDPETARRRVNPEEGASDRLPPPRQPRIDPVNRSAGSAEHPTGTNVAAENLS